MTNENTAADTPTKITSSMPVPAPIPDPLPAPVAAPAAPAPAPSPSPKAALGSAVHYRTREGLVCAAIVSRIHDSGDVSLTVFHDDAAPTMRLVESETSAAGADTGWFWP